MTDDLSKVVPPHSIQNKKLSDSSGNGGSNLVGIGKAAPIAYQMKKKKTVTNSSRRFTYGMAQLNQQDQARFKDTYGKKNAILLL